MTEVYKKYLEETTDSSSIANYDKKIGDKGTTKEDFIEIIIKDESFMDTINSVVKNKNVSVSRDGNLVTIKGSTEKIRQVEKILIEMGIR